MAPRHPHQTPFLLHGSCFLASPTELQHCNLSAIFLEVSTLPTLILLTSESKGKFLGTATFRDLMGEKELATKIEKRHLLRQEQNQESRA